MNKNKNTLLVGLIFVFVVAGSVFYYWSSQPSFVVAKTGYSIFSKSRSQFDKSVDLDKVALGLADDTVTEALKKLGADPLGEPGIVQSALALKMVESLKPQLISHVNKTVDSYFLKEPLVNSSGQSLNSVLLMLLASQSDLKFNWKISTEQNPDFAMVTVGFLNMRTLKPFLLRLRLEKTEHSWKIVRLYNVVESLSEPQ